MQPSDYHEPSIRFGYFELKLRSQELVRDGMTVAAAVMRQHETRMGVIQLNGRLWTLGEMAGLQVLECWRPVRSRTRVAAVKETRTTVIH